MTIRNTDFIKGIAIVSCVNCKRDAFTVEETLLNAVGDELIIAEIRNSVLREKNRKKAGVFTALQHNNDDLDWAYRPYLSTNTKTNYDASPMEGELPS